MEYQETQRGRIVRLKSQFFVHDKRYLGNLLDSKILRSETLPSILHSNNFRELAVTTRVPIQRLDVRSQPPKVAGPRYNNY